MCGDVLQDLFPWDPVYPGVVTDRALKSWGQVDLVLHQKGQMPAMTLFTLRASVAL